MQPSESAHWLRCRRPLDKAKLRARVLALPYAGGGASVFHAWTDDLPSDIEVRALQLPARQDRLNERGLTSVAAAVEKVRAALAALPAAPLLLYGHSYGSLLGFELARSLAAAGSPPLALVVGGRRAAHLPMRAPAIYALPDAAFKEELYQRYGTPRAFLRNDELMALALPPLRADITAHETYEYVPLAKPLDFPIVVLRGRHDASVTADEAAAWNELTSRPGPVHEVDGGHLFVDSHRPWVLARISEVLRSVAGPGPGSV